MSTALEEELESLYPEIEILAEISTRQQFQVVDISAKISISGYRDSSSSSRAVLIVPSTSSELEHRRRN
jgi:hypothetical protein